MVSSFRLCRPFPATLTLLLVTIQSCHAAIAAWWTDIGPQVILQNSTTGLLRYSACNSYDTPTYSYDDGNVLSSSYTPKNGTALSGVGWWDSEKTIASIFFQATDNTLVNVYAECNMTTGLWDSKTYTISNNGQYSAPSVHENTGLASILLGSTGGYRVYFHDEDRKINQITYTTSTLWRWEDVISQDAQDSFAIDAAFTESGSGSLNPTYNISVVSARDSDNVEVTRWNSDQTWHISTFPESLGGTNITDSSNASSISINQTAPVNFTLPAWTGNPGGMGLSIDSDYTRSVFYIGNDSNLYQISNNNYSWAVQTNQSSTFWPQADDASGALGLTSDFDTSNIRIYYFVADLLTEVKYTQGNWQAWTALPTFNATANSTSTGQDGNGTSSASDESLSTGAKAGIGVGVSLGVVALGGATFALWFFRRRHARSLSASGAEVPQEMAGSAAGTGYWQKDKPVPPTQELEGVKPQQLDSSTVPSELDTQPVHEMPGESGSRELE